jgi:RNA polymerase-binding protein DksA
MLDEKTLQELKEKLLEEKKRLEADLQKIATKDNGEYEPNVEDLGRSLEDNAEEVEEYATNLGITETLEKNLHDVEDALERMEKGTYGNCENCNQEIPLERLRVFPAARNCVRCA